MLPLLGTLIRGGLAIAGAAAAAKEVVKYGSEALGHIARVNKNGLTKPQNLAQVTKFLGDTFAKK